MPIRLATPEEMQETRDCREEMQAWEDIGFPLKKREKDAFYQRWGQEVCGMSQQQGMLASDNQYIPSKYNPSPARRPTGRNL